MGVVIDDLWDHEGYAARRLSDGTLTGTWNQATREFTAFVAACGCGWRGEVDYTPTETGEAFAIDQWRLTHAEPLLARQAERRQLELARRLEWLGSEAGRLHDPEILLRVRRQLELASNLVGEVQRDLGRLAPQREPDDER